MKTFGIVCLKDHELCKKLHKFLRSAGHAAHLITKKKELPLLQKCDTLITIAFNMSKLVKGGLRWEIKEICDRRKMPIIYIDRGLFDDPDIANAANIKTVTLNYPKNRGIGYVNGFEKDCSRKEKLLLECGLQVEDWRGKDKSVYSIYVHNVYGYSCMETSITAQLKEIDRTVSAAKKTYGESNVVISYHPAYRKLVNDTRKKECISPFKLFKKSKCSIGWHTNTLALSVLQGVPAICLQSDNMVYDVASKSLDEIVYPDRDEWLNRMSFTQWSVQEIISGEMLEFLGVI